MDIGNDLQKAYDDGYAAATAGIARKICCEIEQEIVAALESNGRVYAEHLTKYGDNPNLEFLCICNAKTYALRGIEDFVEELKKKYTGEQT